MGRPTTNPKKEQISVRLDKECTDILKKYVAKHGVERVEAVRRGIKKLAEDLK